MEAPSTEHSNPFFMFEVSQVCATCTNHLLTGKCYSLDTLVDRTDNINLNQVLVSQCQFKCEENGPSNICTECFSKTLLLYEFHQQCKHSVKLFEKYVEWQKQFLKPDIVDLGISDIDAISTNVEEEQDVKPTIDIEETVTSEAISTNPEEEQDVKHTINIEETVISEAISTIEEEEQDVKLTIDIEETVISEGTLVNANDDFNSLREVVGVESDMSCNSSEVTKSNMLKEKSKQNKLYECTKCDATYDNPRCLSYHRNVHDKKFLCSYCDLPMRSQSELKIHERLHTGELPYPCGKCDKRFVSNASLKKHQPTHTQERPFKCEVCEATFKQKTTLMQHIQIIHIGNREHKCTVCNKMFMWSSRLKRHMHTHEKVASKEKNEDNVSNMLDEEFKQDMMYKCTECDAKYKLYSSFLLHQNIHKKRFVCSHCDHPFSSQAALIMHERIHTGERPYVCGKCGKQFRENCILKRHLVTHTRKRIFKCEICEKTFKTRPLLRHHTQIHMEIKRHKCTECDASFVKAFLLKRHLKNHETDKDENEECVTLNSKSSSQDEETNQQTRESNMLEKKCKQDKLYECEECVATFNLYDSFLLHQNIHKKRFVCSHCDHPSSSQAALIMHERIHTGERPFECGKCGKQFTTKCILKKHLVTHTKNIQV